MTRRPSVAADMWQMLSAHSCGDVDRFGAEFDQLRDEFDRQEPEIRENWPGMGKLAASVKFAPCRRDLT